MNCLQVVIESWIETARAKLRTGTLGEADLDALQSLLRARPPRLQQRLLYLHARDPSVTDEVIAWAEHPGADPGAMPVERPYATVLEAMEDGWQVIHFPQQLAPFDDKDTDIVGYEFILQKLEAPDE